MAYIPTEEDREMARAILEGAGIQGFYKAGDTAVPLLIQWIGSADEIGSGFVETGGRDRSAVGSTFATAGKGNRPFESTAMAYVAIDDVPLPVQNALVWFGGGATHRVDWFYPEGGLWRLDLIPEE